MNFGGIENGYKRPQKCINDVVKGFFSIFEPLFEPLKNARMKGLYLRVGFAALLFSGLTAAAQVDGDYRSRQTGNWTSATTWQVFNSGWNNLETVGAGIYQNVIPSNSSGVITILGSDVVTVNTTVTVDQVIVNDGGSLVIASGGEVVVADGTGIDLDIQPAQTIIDPDTETETEIPAGTGVVQAGGILENAGAISSTAGILTISGTYQHNQNSGTVPTATWSSGSTTEIIGTLSSTAAITGLNQTFYDFVWNPVSQTAGKTLVTGANPGLTLIANDFIIRNTGASGGIALTFTTITTNTTTIQGDLIIEGSSRFNISTSSNTSITVNGNVDISSTVTGVALRITQTGTTTRLIVGGNLAISSGSSDIELTESAASGKGTLELRGNLALGAGTIMSTNAILGGDLTFNRSTPTAPQVLTASSGGFSGMVNYRVASTSRTHLGTVILSGTGTLNVNGILGVGSTHASGALQNTASLDADCGNVVVSGLRTYAAASTIVYNGTAIQRLGDEWSSGGALFGVAVNLDIDNSAGVINNVTGTNNLVGKFTLTNGAFEIGSGNTLIVSGDFEGYNGSTRLGTISGNSDGTSSLTFQGSGSSFGELRLTSGAQTLTNLTLSRGGTVVLGSNLTIAAAGTIAFNSTGHLQFDGRTLTVNGNITQSGSGGLVSLTPTNSNLIIGGSGALTELPFCTDCGTIELNNVSLSRTTGATYTWSTAANIHGTFSLAAGTLTHSSGLTMANGSTFSRNAGASITTNAPGVAGSDRYNVNYTGTLTTGLELPTVASDDLNNLIVGGTVALDKAIQVNGTLTVTSGTLNAGAFGVTLAGPTMSITGTYTSTGTTSFNRSGGGTISITGTPTNITFNNIIISSGTTLSSTNSNINVTGIWTSSGSFSANAGTVTFNGAGQSINANGSNFFNLTIAGTGTKLLTNSLDVNGTLLISSGATLSAGPGNHSIAISGTWDNQGSFTHTAGTVIFDGSDQTIDANGSPFFNLSFATSTSTKTMGSNLDVNGTLTINSGVTLDISSNDYGINLAGDWNNNGTFVRRDGTVVFDGASTQEILGGTTTTFTNILITNSAGPPAVRLEANANLAGVLTLQTNAIFDADGAANNRVFTLLSSADDPTVDAAIATLQSGASVTGSVTVQRFMTIEGANNARIYRYIASSVQSAPVSQIQATIPVTGSFTGTSSCSGCTTAQSMFLYSEPVTTDINGVNGANYDDGYLDFPVNGNTETLASGRGYAVFVRGNIAPVSTAGNALWSVTGPINSGSIDFVSTAGVSFTSSGTLANDGWNLVGNPFPSTIDWLAASGWVKSGINNAIYMRDNGKTTPVYATFVGGVGANGGSRYIPIGQAFFVKSDGGPITFTANESVKVGGTQSKFFREGAITNVLRVAMKQFDVSDETVIRFHDEATAEFDRELDADKLDNATFNLYSRTQGDRRLAINALPQLGCSADVSLDISNVTAGTYELAFSEFESFAPGVQFTLNDNFTHTSTELLENGVYAFTVTADAASYEERFTVTFSNKPIETDLALTGEPVCYGNSASVVLQQSQEGVMYTTYVGDQSIGESVIGNGQSLTIQIPKEKLVAGDNIVSIKGNFPSCDAIVVTAPYHLKSEIVVDPQALASSVVCESGSTTLKVTGASQDASYRWYTSETGTEFIPNQFSDTYVTPELSASRTYFVSVINAAGCEGKHVPVTATVQDVVPVAVTADAYKLTSSYENGNQWYHNGEKIEGATGKVYEPDESGVYTVIATTGTCTTSAEIDYAVTGVTESAPDARYSIFPTPTKGAVHIQVRSSSPAVIHLNSPLGKRVISQGLRNEGAIQTGTIDLTEYASGVYILTIEDGGEIYRRKIIRE
jgi:hypothetical protein